MQQIRSFHSKIVPKIFLSRGYQIEGFLNEIKKVQKNA